MKFFASFIAGCVAFALAFAPVQASNLHHGVTAGATATTLNDLDKNSAISLDATKLIATDANFGTAFISVRSVASVTGGLYYMEATKTNVGGSNVAIGLSNASGSLSNFPGNEAIGIGTLSGDGNIYANGGSPVGSLGATWATAGDRVDMALDATNKTVWFRKAGGLWNNSGTANPATNTGGIALPISLQTGAIFVMATVASNSPADVISTNFGAIGFADTPPAGAGNFH